VTQPGAGVRAPVENRTRWVQLGILATAMVLAMSTWFSTAAVLPQLRADWDLSQVGASWLAISVQLGFVSGAVVSSVLNLADRIPPRRFVLFGTVGAALANLLTVGADGLPVAVPARFLVGACLAGVYAPALKAMSTWFVRGRGLALGAMVGALTLGSALPHLINGVGSLEWQVLIVITSITTVVGGLVAVLLGRDGPHRFPTAVFNPAQIRDVVANPRVRLASTGYFGHMWELYAMWTWVAAFAADVVSGARAASLVAFGAIGIGAAGCVVGGLISDRTSRCRAAGMAMTWSGAVAAFVGFLVDWPAWIVVALLLVWGFWVVADSAQFSTIVTEVADQRYVGTALTMQLAIGFTLTVFTIFLVPVVRDALGWGWAFALLVPGPAVGTWAMRRLERLTAAPTAAAAS